MIDHLVVNLKSVALLTRVKSLKEEGKQLCGNERPKKNYSLSNWGERQYIGNEYFSIFPGQ